MSMKPIRKPALKMSVPTTVDYTLLFPRFLIGKRKPTVSITLLQFNVTGILFDFLF